MTVVTSNLLAKVRTPEHLRYARARSHRKECNENCYSSTYVVQHVAYKLDSASTPAISIETLKPAPEWLLRLPHSALRLYLITGSPFDRPGMHTQWILDATTIRHAAAMLGSRRMR